ncbi:three-Cys-motif partner protein TcmP [Pontibacter sp. KCTC 32443]|uniref:three-Cys-motif partner protein TcmP n=1 Tax=Pontibacter TaxID=323449 RepID=UPI00164D5647|nr:MULTISPECIES: three-Cys-motif partner protein TcmP [Pontibacter]MBC5773704.1 three-Cys-motif partner protein TcmP [Pontibacter sp. KCTC 32443]
MPATEFNAFFTAKRSFTEIKQEVFGKYFEAWNTLRLSKKKEDAQPDLLLIDLHAGEEQALADNTPLPAHHHFYIYKSIFKQPKLNQAIHTFFYDKNKAILEQAGQCIEALPYYEELVHQPLPLATAENKALMTELLESGCSSLVFMDPFQGSYAQQVLGQAISSGQSDLFMLLSPETITRAVAGKKVSPVLAELFGERLQVISNYCRKEKAKSKRQQFILDHFIQALHAKECLTLLFKINLPDTEDPEHYLLFASRDGHAYRSFKETMLPYSILQEDDVPLFIANDFLQPQTSLFEQVPEFTIPNLVERITNQANLYKYKSIEKMYELDSPGTNYIRENYVAACEQLRKAGKIELLNPKTMQAIRQPTPAAVVKYKVSVNS